MSGKGWNINPDAVANVADVGDECWFGEREGQTLGEIVTPFP